MALTLLVGCGSPFLVLPGGELEGPVAAPPADWAFTKDISTVQLETRPEDPYSVNIWAVAVGDSLYLHAGENRARWVENIEANPDVRVEIEGEIYELAASRVEGKEEFVLFSDEYEIKYGRRPRNENVDEVYVYRLGAR